MTQSQDFVLNVHMLVFTSPLKVLFMLLTVLKHESTDLMSCKLLNIQKPRSKIPSYSLFDKVSIIPNHFFVHEFGDILIDSTMQPLRRGRGL